MPTPFRILSLASPDGVLEAAVAAVNDGGQAVADTREITTDDLAHEALLARGFAAITVLCGADEAALMAEVERSLDRELPGLAEIFRQALHAHIGPLAALASLSGGRCGDGVLVAVPGNAQVVKVALAEVLVPIAPQLCPPRDAPGQDVQRLSAAAPASRADDDDTPGRVDMVQLGDTAAPAPPAAPGGSGWQAGLAAIGGVLDRGRFPPLPESFQRLAPARNVLETAGERGMLTLPDGRTMTAFGFPDLLRPGSKVLLVAEGEPLAEVVALHRHPRQVGVVVHGSGGLLPSADLDPDGPAVALTGTALPSFGTLFAVDGSALYYLRERRVYSWDGRKERDEGTPSQVIASLVLRWSQR